MVFVLLVILIHKNVINTLDIWHLEPRVRTHESQSQLHFESGDRVQMFLLAKYFP